MPKKYPTDEIGIAASKPLPRVKRYKRVDELDEEARKRYDFIRNTFVEKALGARKLLRAAEGFNPRSIYHFADLVRELHLSFPTQEFLLTGMLTRFNDQVSPSLSEYNHAKNEIENLLWRNDRYIENLESTRRHLKEMVSGINEMKRETGHVRRELKVNPKKRGRRPKGEETFPDQKNVAKLLSKLNDKKED